MGASHDQTPSVAERAQPLLSHIAGYASHRIYVSVWCRSALAARVCERAGDG